MPVRLDLVARSPKMTDEELLSSCCAGEMSSFSQLYLRHASALHFYVQSLTRDRDHADDILQNVFLRLLEIDPSSIRTSVKAFLYVIARNEVFEEGRRASRARHLPILAEPFRRDSVVDPERAGVRSVTFQPLKR